MHSILGYLIYGVAVYLIIGCIFIMIAHVRMDDDQRVEYWSSLGAVFLSIVGWLPLSLIVYRHHQKWMKFSEEHRARLKQLGQEIEKVDKTS